MWQRRHWVLGLLLLVSVLALVGFIVWASMTPAPMAEALAALQPDNLRSVNHEASVRRKSDQE